MIKASVRMYLASNTRLAFMEKLVEFVAMPRVGEYVKIKNDRMGNYFAFNISEVTHIEGEAPDVMLSLWKDENRYDLFKDESELDEYIESYKAEGWTLRSLKENRIYRNATEQQAPPDLK